MPEMSNTHRTGTADAISLPISMPLLLKTRLSSEAPAPPHYYNAHYNPVLRRTIRNNLVTPAMPTVLWSFGMLQPLKETVHLPNM